MAQAINFREEYVCNPSSSFAKRIGVINKFLFFFAYVYYVEIRWMDYFAWVYNQLMASLLNLITLFIIHLFYSCLGCVFVGNGRIYTGDIVTKSSRGRCTTVWQRIG